MIKFILFFLFLSSPLFAVTNEQRIAQGLAQFKNGNYPEAILLIKDIKNNKLYGTKYYIMGLSYSKLQEFDLAEKFLVRAVKFNNKSLDIYYELGQAHYANNNLEKSRVAFRKSYKNKYKTYTALYYMGHISQILEEFKKAKKYYSILAAKKDINTSLLQISQFQLSESLLSIAKKKKQHNREIVKKYILPQFKKAEKIDVDTILAKDIRKRIKEIKVQFQLDPNILSNGRRLPEKRYTVMFSQKMKYDNNVTMEDDLPTVESTLKDSFIFDTTFLAKYKLSILNKFIIEPELRGTHTLYADRNESTIYKNDTLSLAPALRNSLEHKLFKKPASLILNFEYNYTQRDVDGTKTKSYAGKSTTISFGEKFRLFSFGDTTITYKKRTYEAYLVSSNNKTTTLSLNQVVILPTRHLLLLMFIHDGTRLDIGTFSDTNSMLFRFDYIWPNFYEKYSLKFAMALTFLDTLEQSEIRGTEKTYNPSIELSKTINKYMKYSLSFDYTNSTSLLSSNEYDKQVLTFELKFNF